MQAITRFFVDRWQFSAVLFALLAALFLFAIRPAEQGIEHHEHQQRHAEDEQHRHHSAAPAASVPSACAIPGSLGDILNVVGQQGGQSSPIPHSALPRTEDPLESCPSGERTPGKATSMSRHIPRCSLDLAHASP